MSDKMIEIKGKKVSEETIVEALKEHLEFQEEVTAPIISFGIDKESGEHRDVAIIRLTDDMLASMDLGGGVIVIDTDGAAVEDDTDLFYKFEEFSPKPVFGTLIKRVKKRKKKGGPS